MKLGSDDVRDHSEPRRLRRKRTAWLVVSGAFVALCLLFAGGTAWSLAYQDSPWGDGELTARLLAIVGAALLAMVASLRGQHFGIRAEDAEEAEGTNPRPRVHSRRVAVLCGSAFVLLALGVSGFLLIHGLGQRLFDEGTRTLGTVVRVHDAPKSTSWITVEYVGRDRVRMVRINRNSDLEYTVGQQVTVVFDPNDPRRVRTLQERNDEVGITVSSYFLTFAGCVGIPASAFASRNPALARRRKP